MIALAGTTIKTAKDLEGKRIAMTPGDSATASFPAVLNANKIPREAVTIVQVDSTAKPVLVMEKRADALPLLTTAADEQTRKEVLFQLAIGSAENGELPRAMDLGHELANIDYVYKNIGKLLDEWQAQGQRA